MCGRYYESPESLEDLEKVMLAIISFNEDKHNRNFKAGYLSRYAVDLDANLIWPHLKYLKRLGVLENGMEKCEATNRAKSYRLKNLAKMKRVARSIFQDHKEYFN